MDRILFAGLSLFGIAVSAYALPWPNNACAAGLAVTMAAISVSDWRRFIIPDWLSLPAIPAGLLVSGVVTGSTTSLIAPQHIFGMVVGAGALWAVRKVYHLARGREGLGLGDVKLAAVAGAWTGLGGFAHVLLVASTAALAIILMISLWHWLLGSTTRLSAETAIPFGAFLAPAIWLVYALQSSSVLPG